MSNLHLVSDQEDAASAHRDVGPLFSSPGFRQRYERARLSILEAPHDAPGRPSQTAGRESPPRPEAPTR